MIDHVLIRLGLDASEVGRTMRTLTGTFKKWGDGISKSISDSFKSAFRNFGALFSVAGIVAMTRRLANMADEVKGASEALGVSTDFIQGFRTAVSQNSGTVEQANKGLEKLSMLAGQGSKSFEKWGISLTDVNGRIKTTQELILEISDKMKSATSGAERSAIAFDFFGKSGAALIPTLLMGSEALEAYIASSKKLSAEDIVRLANAQDALSLALDKTTIAFGGLVGGLMRAGEAWDYLSSKTREDRVSRIAKQFLRLQSQVSGAGMLGVAYATIGALPSVLGDAAGELDASRPGAGATPSESGKTELTNLDKAQDILSLMTVPLRQILNLKEIALKVSKLQTEQIKKQLQLERSKADLASEKSDRGKYTLEELASVNPFQFRRGSFARNDIFNARRVQNLEGQAKNLNLTPDQRNNLLSEADKLRGGIGNLKDSERFPFKKMEESLALQQADVAAIREQMIGVTTE